MNNIELRTVLKHAFEEDIGFGDLTSISVFPAAHHSGGAFVAKDPGIAAGLAVIEEAYQMLNPAVEVSLLKNDGDSVEPGAALADVHGPTGALLSGERVILNLLQHLCGIATATDRAIKALDDPDIRICDTRKTLPGLRMLQKYAIRCGGGFNHRYRLDGGVMIKDNHIAAAGSIAKAIQQARKQAGPMARIEVETETRDQVLEAVEAGADIIMFDNRPPREVTELAKLVPEHIITEVSGGITEETIGGYRNSNIDYISLGFLTHSVIALDIGFNLNESTKQNR